LSILSSGRDRDKVAGAADKTKEWVKETSSSLTGKNEKRAEGRADQLKGVAKDKKGHLKDLLKFPLPRANLYPHVRAETLYSSGSGFLFATRLIPDLFVVRGEQVKATQVSMASKKEERGR
jgi:uncharacterized protein YjbJ (UPF0337 family)